MSKTSATSNAFWTIVGFYLGQAPSRVREAAMEASEAVVRSRTPIRQTGNLILRTVGRLSIALYA